MQSSAVGREAETKTESQVGLPVAQDDSVALAALPCRQLRAGFAPPDSKLAGRRGSSDFAIISYHFAPGKGVCRIDRSRFRICTCAGRWTRLWGVERFASRAGTIRGRNQDGGRRADGGGRRRKRGAKGAGRRTVGIGRDLHRGITLVSFRTRGRQAGGSTEDMGGFAFAEGGRTGFGVCARSRAGPWRLGEGRAVTGGGFGFEFG